MGHQECGTQESKIGLEVFLTETPGIGGLLKRQPEDFIVDEISRMPPQDPNGRFTIAKVTSENWETNRLVRQISRYLGISRNRISFAGTKDKRAITSQLMCFEAPLEAVAAISMHQVRVENAYRSRKHITIGDLIGNSFQLKVRDCGLSDGKLSDAVQATHLSLQAVAGFPNFFGVQRFGSLRPITHLVGQHIVRGEFELACLAYAANPVEHESPEAKAARSYLQDTKDYAGALRMLPRPLMFERTVVGHLAQEPGDFTGAIKSLPRNLQMMFVHAYQAYLFNRILSERIRRDIPINAPIVGDIVLPTDKDGLPDHDKHVPVTRHNLDLVAAQVKNGRASVSAILFGSDSVMAEGEPGEIERLMIEREGVRREDFVVPPIPECSSRGSRREIVARYWDFQSSAEAEVLDMSFSLGKGCYATCLLREFMKEDMIERDRLAYQASTDEDEAADS